MPYPKRSPCRRINGILQARSPIPSPANTARKIGDLAASGLAQALVRTPLAGLPNNE
jgi:hypothetical protein